MLETLTSKPTLLGAGGSHALQQNTILDVFGGSQSVVLTPSVMKQIDALLTIKSCACGCGESFITTQKHQKYVDSVHRQRAYRVRNSTATSTEKLCLWCASSNMPKAKTARFCSQSHRVMSYRKQRQGMLTTFAQFSCISLDDAHEIVDRVGAKSMRLVLEDANYQYDYRNRVWVG